MVKYNSLGPEDISIIADVDSDNLTLRLIDFEETPFDISKKTGPDLDSPIEQRKPGGLGIHLVKNMVDKIDYEHTDNKSTVTLIMRLE